MFQRTKICSGLLIAIGSGAFSVSGAALAQDTSVQRVEIIGSSIKRVDTETDAPITTMTREDIAKTGATSVEELLRSVTASQSSNSTAAASASGATTGGISTISLRGLGPSRTLVLINGQRTAPYGDPADSTAVDVDAIPVAAIERIEILKEGAGAIYGSDAVAGVVNFVLRKDFTGTEVNLYAGTSYDHKGTVTKGSIVSGFNGSKGNATFILTGEHDLPLYGRDRGFARTNIFPAHDNSTGSSFANPGNFSIPGISGLYNAGVPVDPSTMAPTANAASTANCGTASVYSPQFAKTYCLFDPAPFVSLEPDIKKVGLLFNGHYDFSDSLSLHGDASITNKKQFVSIQPSPIGAAFGIPFSLSSASPYYPTSFIQPIATAHGMTDLPTLSVRYRPFITGNRNLTDQGTNERASVGVDGNVAGWDYSANATYSASQVTESIVNGYFRINGSPSTGPGIVPLLSGDVKDANGNTLWVNPFGANSDAVIAAAAATNFHGTAFRTSTSLQDVQVKMSKDDLLKLPGGSVAVAFGGEARRDTFALTSSPALASGDISGYGGSFVPIDKFRNVYSAFAELDVPVIKGLDIDGAIRYDRYGATSNPNTLASTAAALGNITTLNVAGDTVGIPAATIATLSNQAVTNASSFGHTTGKIGAKWEVSKSMLFRTTFSTGFRAPSLLELYSPINSGVTATVNDPQRCHKTGDGDADCAAQYNQFAGGNGALKPERSTTFTLGTVMEPVKDVSFALDYFRTKLKDEIAFLTPEYLLSHESQYQSYIIRDTGDAVNGTAGPIIAIDQREQNVGEADLAGLDFDTHTSFKTTAGTFGVGVAGTWQLKWDNVNPDGSRESQIGTTANSVSGYTPRVKGTLEGTWRSPDAKWELTGIYNWQKGGTDVCGNRDLDDFGNCQAGITPPKFKSYGTTDLQVKWDPAKKFSGTIGVKDAFNAKPPYVNGAGGAFQGGYDPTYVDPHGRFWYASTTIRF